ncbi:MAG: selenium cofactor biosynthesis protein YqeC [Bacillota bacterium]
MVEKNLLDIWQITPGQITWLAGAGGKTTTLLQLARELRYRRVVLTTTTSILLPKHIPYTLELIRNQEELAQVLKKHLTRREPKALVIGSQLNHDSTRQIRSLKLSGIEPAWLQESALAYPDLYYLVEADGANRRPVKLAADYEPVVAEKPDNFMLVQGLKPLGRKSRTHLNGRTLHRAELITREKDFRQYINLAFYRSLFLDQKNYTDVIAASARARIIISQVSSGKEQFAWRLAGCLLESSRLAAGIKSITAVNYRKSKNLLFHIARGEK